MSADERARGACGALGDCADSLIVLSRFGSRLLRRSTFGTVERSVWQVGQRAAEALCYTALNILFLLG